ncbi:MAG: thioredoxin-disulfide reductase [Bacillota bacterium]|nr:thioredoxin-disulfide reductase [Bacillota bacterium]
MSSGKGQEKVYDMIILGGGPAGLTAAIYGGRANLEILIVEHMMSGGEIASTDKLDNYPGFPEGITGSEFGQLLEQHALRFGAEMISASIDVIDTGGEIKKVSTSKGDYYGRTIVIATGTAPGLLGVPGEETLRGKGISFCATCDGFFFRDKKIAVIGGGDSAVKEAIYLTRFASEIVLIHRRNKLRAVPALQNQILQNPKVSFLWDTVVTEFRGDQALTTLATKNLKDSTVGELYVDGAFLYVGRIPNTGFLKGLEVDGQGYIITSEEMETSIPGVFAAGDVRRKYLRQVITAASDGAIAAMMAVRYLE